MQERHERQVGHNTIDRHPGWGLWLWWVLATAVSASLVLIAVNWFVFFSVADNPEVALSDDNAIGPLVLFGCGLVGLVGPVVGLAQGLVMRRTIQFKNWGLWAVTDTLGVVAIILATPFFGVLTGGNDQSWIWVVVPGAVLGLVHQLVLWSYTPNSGWWVLISWISWIVAALAGAFFAVVTNNVVHDVFHIQTQTRFAYPFYPPELAISWSVGYIVGAFVFGGLTGLGLVWLLRRRRSFIAQV